MARAPGAHELERAGALIAPAVVVEIRIRRLARHDALVEDVGGRVRQRVEEVCVWRGQGDLKRARTCDLDSGQRLRLTGRDLGRSLDGSQVQRGYGGLAGRQKRTGHAPGGVSGGDRVAIAKPGV